MSNYNLQYYLCKLITNPHLLEQNIFSIRKLLNSLHIEKDIKKQLLKFFKENGTRFLASARILKKRRRDNIYNNMPIVTQYFDHNLLDEQWDNYLLHLVSDNVSSPQNPLIESIHFIRYIEQKISYLFSTTVVAAEVLKYERIRNEVIIGYSQFQDVNYIIHPSFSAGEFSSGGLEVIKSSITPELNNKNSSLDTQSVYLILFFKNWIKGGVTTAKIAHRLYEILNSIRYAVSLEQAQSILRSSYSLNIEEITALFKLLLTQGIMRSN